MEATTLRRHGYGVSVICPKSALHPAAYECLEGVHVYRHWLPAERSSAVGYLREYACALFWQFFLALRIKRRHGFDVIHACNPPDLIFLVAAFFKLAGRSRFLFDHHDLSPELYESKFGRRGFFHALLLLAEKMTFGLADHAIATNESYRQIAIERGRMNPEAVTVVRSAPDTRRFRRVARDEAFLRGKRFLVGYVGVMAEFDGVDQLVRAAHELVVKRGRTDLQFCLIGDGPSLPRLRALSAELGLAACFEFTGRIPDHELIARLSSCDVGVTPDPKTPFNDRSTMNKTLEYMTLGVPVVQYDLTEGRRSAGPASLYAKPGDVVDLATQIEALLKNPQLREQMGAHGVQRIACELSWECQESWLLSAYARTLGRQADGPAQAAAKSPRSGNEEKAAS